MHKTEFDCPNREWNAINSIPFRLTFFSSSLAWIAITIDFFDLQQSKIDYIWSTTANRIDHLTWRCVFSSTQSTKLINSDCNIRRLRWVVRPNVSIDVDQLIFNVNCVRSRLMCALCTSYCRRWRCVVVTVAGFCRRLRFSRTLGGAVHT